MGAGKSTLAREAARALGVALRDTDALVEAAARRADRRALGARGRGVVPRRRGARGARGAGGPAGGRRARRRRARVRARARGAARARRRATSTSTATRPGRAPRARGRPLARDRAAFDALYAERLPVLPRGRERDAAGVGARRCCAGRCRACARWPRAAPRACACCGPRASPGDYPAWFGERALTRGAVAAARGLAAPRRQRRATSPTCYAGRVPELAALIEIPAGEAHKSLETAERVWRALVAQRRTRADHLVAVGGGVVGDLAGFVAATFQRGIPVVQVPTTLVAQVDSAYGGKTGVDLPRGQELRRRLPPAGGGHRRPRGARDAARRGARRRLRRGREDGADRRRRAVGARSRAGAPVDDDVILECARTKLAVVAADERDGGRRQVLNLGHTVGHAIEAVTGYGRAAARRGGRPRPARRAAAVGRGRAARAGRRAARRGRPAADVDGVDADAVLDDDAPRQEARRRAASRSSSVRRPATCATAPSSSLGEVRAAVAELDQRRRVEAQREQRPAPERSTSA